LLKTGGGLDDETMRDLIKIHLESQGELFSFIATLGVGYAEAIKEYM
jgi:hypothetical protein